jgi:hypothetical protein
MAREHQPERVQNAPTRHSPRTTGIIPARRVRYRRILRGLMGDRWKLAFEGVTFRVTDVSQARHAFTVVSGRDVCRLTLSPRSNHAERQN